MSRAREQADIEDVGKVLQVTQKVVQLETTLSGRQNHR